MDPIRIAVVGVGKIARDQHLPALAADDRFALAAIVAVGGKVCSGRRLWPAQGTIQP